MNENFLLKKNEYLYYGLRFFRQLIFFLPIYTLFYLENGLNMLQVVICTSSMMVVNQIFEIPSGIFADLYGRKISVIIGGIINFIGVMVIFYSYNFWMFLLGNSLFGISFSFVSGSLQALVFDTFKENNKPKKFLKIEGNAFFFYGIGMSLSGIGGGIISHYLDYRAVYLFTLIPSFIWIIISFMFYEPKIDTSKNKDFLKHYKESFNFVKKHKKVISLIMYFGFNLLLMFIFFNFLQLYVKSFGITDMMLGVFYTGFLLMSAIGAKSVYGIERLIGERYSLILSPFLIFCGYLLIVSFDNLIIGVIGICLIEFVFGFFIPLVSSYLNNHIPSKYRATINSFETFAYGILILIFLPIFGRLIDVYSIFLALKILLFLSLLSFIIFSIIFIKNGKKINFQ